MTQAKMSIRYTARCTAIVLSLAALAGTGCRIEKTSSGNGDNVKMATPFGGLSVKTDDKAVEAETGLPQYPGATVVNKASGGDDDTGAADVNMSFGGFQLRVKAVSYKTGDSPEKVLAFYRKGLARFGTVIQCSGDHAVGTPAATPDGLTCSDDSKGKRVQIDNHDHHEGGMELKAGSEKHQHIVSIDPDGTGTKFGLVALDLPGKFPFGLDNDSDSDKGSDKDKGKSNQPE